MERKCPFCAELIKTDAILCKHCNQPVTPVAVVPTVTPEPVVVIEETITRTITN